MKRSPSQLELATLGAQDGSNGTSRSHAHAQPTALTIPVVFLSRDVQRWFGYTVPSFPGSSLLAPVLGTIIFFYGGLVFIRGAWNEIADRKPGMMTLISLGITVAFFTSLAGTFGLFKIEVWWELATLTTIMMLGH